MKLAVILSLFPSALWYYIVDCVQRYRAPEVLLQSRCYGPAIGISCFLSSCFTHWPSVLYFNEVSFEAALMCFIDMWAMGAIMAELFNLRPLFPGDRLEQVLSDVFVFNLAYRIV